MLQGELRSVILAIIAAAILAPFLGWLTSRVFPPKGERGDGAAPASHRLRNQIIEYASVCFFIAGAAMPFLLQGTVRLKPTAANIALILSFGLLFAVGGTAALTALFGDRKAASFRRYIEQERRISSTGVQKIARVMVTGSIIALVAVLFFNW